MPSPSASSTAPVASQAVAGEHTPLFRLEAIEAKQDQLLGSIRIAHTPSFTAVALSSLAIVAALGAYAAWGEVTRKVRATGLLAPAGGSLQIPSHATGIVTQVLATEGQQVAQGSVLFEIDTDRGGAQGATAALVDTNIQTRRAALLAERSSRQLMASQRSQALRDRGISLESEIRQNEAEIELSERRVELAQKSLARSQQLAQVGFVADAQSQLKAEELLDTKSRAQTLQRARTALQRELAATKAELANTAAQLGADMAQFDRSLAGIDQERTENTSRRVQVVRAAQSGVLSALVVKPGQMVQAGQNLATVVPTLSPSPHAAPTANGSHSPAAQNLNLEGQLYVASRFSGFVEPGQAVWLRYAAFPYQKFGMAQGEVVEVSRTPILPQDLPAGQAASLLGAAGANEPLFRVSVRLAQQHVGAYGAQHALKPGMALEADVMQESRPVWQWVFEPLLAARQHLSRSAAPPQAQAPAALPGARLGA